MSLPSTDALAESTNCEPHMGWYGGSSEHRIATFGNRQHIFRDETAEVTFNILLELAAATCPFKVKMAFIDVARKGPTSHALPTSAAIVHAASPGSDVVLRRATLMHPSQQRIWLT
eukprot:CAMPEP_0172876460 /NCGR_PEP_ID=MMETSP1075-20121228/104359_1 /TAXON_ID=2916 /ORGANISM="Ceratium fusus, Strain PA161109" /LENGTH=115 /DNA_ID=CAMNT_0013727785 /DNA_START=153 /DNA_END=501 /DNA_ORIENTATION=-